MDFCILEEASISNLFWALAFGELVWNIFKLQEEIQSYCPALVPVLYIWSEVSLHTRTASFFFLLPGTPALKKTVNMLWGKGS